MGWLKYAARIEELQATLDDMVDHAQMFEGNEIEMFERALRYADTLSRAILALAVQVGEAKYAERIEELQTTLDDMMDRAQRFDGKEVEMFERALRYADTLSRSILALAVQVEEE